MGEVDSCLVTKLFSRVKPHSNVSTTVPPSRVIPYVSVIKDTVSILITRVYVMVCEIQHPR